MRPTVDLGLKEKLELISFEIAGQEFCIDIHHVREIRGWTAVTPVPQSASAMMGVINLRGAVMPVIDLRQRLGFGATVPTSRHVIIVGQDGSRVAGFLVDAVQEALQIDADLPQDPPENPEDSGLIDAIIPLDGRMLSRLVMNAMLPQEAKAAA